MRRTHIKKMQGLALSIKYTELGAHEIVNQDTFQKSHSLSLFPKLTFIQVHISVSTCSQQPNSQVAYHEHYLEHLNNFYQYRLHYRVCKNIIFLLMQKLTDSKFALMDTPEMRPSMIMWTLGQVWNAIFIELHTFSDMPYPHSINNT